MGLAPKILCLLMLVFLLAGCGGCGVEEDPDPDVGVGDDVGDEDVADGDADVDDGEEPPDCPLEFEDDGEMRVFVFGSLIQVEDAVSYESYEAYFRNQVFEIADCLSEERPNFLVFAEDVGLHAALIGSRGANARAAQDSQIVFMNLLAAYGQTANHVNSIYENLELPRRIFLAVTDTIWRAVHETFSGIARDYGVWVLTSANVAEVEERSDEESIGLWADPDLENVESVYVPTSRHVFNSAIIYNPDGELVTRVHKPFLTSGEEEVLALSYGPLETLRPVVVGPERLGVFTSKDAWMPPANDRLGLLGSTVQVQPEAFGGWTVVQVNEDEWLPDVLTQSGWGYIQKYPSFRYGLMPVLTGNFFELVFDGQAVVWGQAHPGVEFGAFVGQEERPGFLEVGPWAFEDPQGSLEERREQLRELGEEMLPGGELADAYVDSVVGRDLKGGLEYTAGQRDWPQGAVGPGTALGEVSGAPVQRVRMATRGDRLAAVWQVEVEGRQRLGLALLDVNANGEFQVLREGVLDVGEAGATEDLVAPVVVFNESEEAVVFFQIATESTSRLAGLRVGETDTEEVVFAAVADELSDVWLPALAADGDRIVAAFTSRHTGQDRVYVAVSEDGGATFGGHVAVEEEPSVAPPNTRGIQWHPAVALRGEQIAIAWTDFRAFQWDIYGSFSEDGGSTWHPVRRLDGAGEGFERIHTDPRLVFMDDEELALSWTYQADRRPDTDARWRTWHPGEGSLGAEVVLDGPAAGYPTQAWKPAVAAVEDGVAVAWMELSEETTEIKVVVAAGETRQVSNPNHVAWWPELVVAGEHLLVAWVEHAPGAGYSVRLAVVE